MSTASTATSGARPALSRAVLDALRAIVGPTAVTHEPEDLLVFEYDAYQDRALPQVVVQPRTGKQAAPIVRGAARENLGGRGWRGACWSSSAAPTRTAPCPRSSSSRAPASRSPRSCESPCARTWRSSRGGA